MRVRKLGVSLALISLLGSDIGSTPSPAFGQAPSTGNGQTLIPSLGGTDGAYGRVLPGPSTTTPYTTPQTQAGQPATSSAQPQMIQRPVGPTLPNTCQPGGSPRPYQTVSIPRARPIEPGPPAQQASPTTVTQITLSQPAPFQPALSQPAIVGASPQSGQPPVVEPKAPGNSSALAAPEAEELSRIEAGYNLDPTQVPQSPAYLGPFGTPLRQYGYSMFAANVSTFAPVDDIPVGPDYVLGPGDDLTINVWGAVDSTLVRTVDRNGRIVLPKVGDLRIWGLTFSQADRLIRDELARFFRGFQTSVTMGRLRTVSVHVVGEVCQPGVYTLSSLATVTNALYSAGGPTKLGSLREVRLLRGNVQVARIDLYDFLQRGDRTRDYRLESGDTIFVPPVGDVVAVSGEVKRPAIYEISGGTRLADVVTMSGGVTPTSYLKRVQIVRALPNAERVTLDVDLTSHYLKGDESSNPPINAGDLILIHRSDPRIYNVVKLEGAVRYPGTYELKPMMRIAQLLPADLLLPEAYIERVEVARRRPDLSMEIVAVDLRKAWNGDASQDLLLKPLDEITVRTELKSARTVQLSGQIARPGVYTISEGERLSSVLERAGGFTDRAFLKGALFTRAALRKIEQEQLDAFLKVQEQRLLSTASTVTVGAEKEEIASQQQALQARRDMLKILASKVVVGRMVVRLDAPDKLKGTDNDVVLTDGDTLNVPEPPQSVLVLGAVRNSTSVQYKEGASVDYYINRVGGFSREADQKEAHIVKADGSAVSSFTNVRTIEPGDTVVVPPKEEEKIRWMSTVRDIATIIGAALLGVAALVAIF
jgi:protein involved in polysaccharide export with SLBB domain